MDMINGSKIMESSSTMGTIGYVANSIICSSVTNNAFSIERSHNDLASKKFVISFLAAYDNHCGSCLGDYEPTDEWLQCLICKVCFHSNCFFD